MVHEKLHWYIDEFKKRLCDSDRCPTMSSLRQYAYSLLWLETRMDFPEKGLPKPELVLEYLENAKVTSSRRSAVYTALRKWHGCHDEKKCSDKYSKPLAQAMKDVLNGYNLQRRTKKQEDNWVEFPALKKFANDLRDEVLGLDKNHFWLKEQFVKAQLAFILQFHLRHPIRRDLATVKWSSRKDKQWGGEGQLHRQRNPRGRPQLPQDVSPQWSAPHPPQPPAVAHLGDAPDPTTEARVEVPRPHAAEHPLQTDDVERLHDLAQARDETLPGVREEGHWVHDHPSLLHHTQAPQ